MARSSDETQRASLDGHRPFEARELLAFGLLAVLMIEMLAMSWARWLDPVVDAGRDLYIPEWIASGHIKLYRDVLYFYPPLTPYALAGVVRVFGSSLEIYAMIGIAISVIVAATLYLGARMTTGSPVAAFLTAFLFLAINFTGATTPGSNFIFPYAHAAVLAMGFFLLYLVLMLRYLFGGRGRMALLSAFIFGLLASWTKIEYAAFFVLSIALLAVIHRIPVAWLAGLAAAGTALFAGAWSFFSDAPPGQHWLFDNILAPTLLHGRAASHFYSEVLGTIDLGHNLRAIAEASALSFIALGAIATCERVWKSGRKGRIAMIALLLLIVAGASIILSGDNLFFQGWSLIQLLLIPFALTRRERRGPLAVLLLFSLLASSRVFFRLVPAWYGFAFTLPLYLLIVYVLFRWLPDRGVHSVRWSLAWVPLLLLIGFRGVEFQRHVYDRYRFPVVTPRGTFMESDAGRAAALDELFRIIDRAPRSGLVVFPEGLALNYLSNVRNPTAFHTFTPIEIATPTIESRILEQLKQTRPELVVILSRNVSEFGYEGFGIDYAWTIWTYLTSRYAPIANWKSGSFTMVLARRTSRNGG